MSESRSSSEEAILGGWPSDLNFHPSCLDYFTHVCISNFQTHKRNIPRNWEGSTSASLHLLLCSVYRLNILMEDLSPSCYSLLDLDPELLWITVSFIEDKAALQRSCRCLRQGARMEGNTMQEHRGEASYHFAFADDLPVYI